MIPIPSPELPPIQLLPPEISSHIVSYLPSISKGPDKYSSVVLAWREIRGFVRSQRFKSVTITGKKDPNSALPLKLKFLMDILADVPSIAGCVRHITVEYDQKHQMDPYPHLPRLFNLCRDIQSAKLDSLLPPSCLGFAAAYDLIATSLNPNLDASTDILRPTMSKLHIISFKGTVSELYNFLVEFPALTNIRLTSCTFKDLKTFSGRSVLPHDTMDFDNPPDWAHNPVPVGFRPLTNISVLHFDGRLGTACSRRSDDAFMDLLGSSQTLFPNVEWLYYRFPKVLVRVQRLVNRLASLKALELIPMQDQFTSPEMLVLPPQLEHFGFKVSPFSSDLSVEGSHVRTLKQVSQSGRTLKRVKIDFSDTDDLDEIPAKFAQVGGLDDILASDELGVERLDLVIQLVYAWKELPNHTELNWKIFLQQEFPKVLQRFFGKSSRAKGYEGILHWYYVSTGLTVLDDELLVWGDDNT